MEWLLARNIFKHDSHPYIVGSDSNHAITYDLFTSKQGLVRYGTEMRHTEPSPHLKILNFLKIMRVHNFNVVCMKWGTKYGPEYVISLRNMVARNLSFPHRFLCFTDMNEGLPRDIEVRPLPHCPTVSGREEEAWRKLSLFSRNLGDLEGPTLFIDLDVIIVGPIDDFFPHAPGSFCIIHNWTHPDRRVGNSSVFRFEAGRHEYVFDAYLRDHATIVERYRNEQIFLTHMVDQAEGVEWWPPEWCVSFKKHCLPRGVTKLLRPSRIPPGARIVAFHGDPKPPDAAIRWRYKGHHFMRPAPWILDYWK